MLTGDTLTSFKKEGIPCRYDANDRLIEDEEAIKKFNIDNNIVLKPTTNFYDDSSSARSSSNDDDTGSDIDAKVDGNCDDVKDVSRDGDVYVDETKSKNNKKQLMK